VFIPLSAQDAPTAAPFLSTHTPTLATAQVVTPTTEAGTQTEQVIVELPERVTFDGLRFQIVGFELERSDHTLDSVTITVQNISDLPASGTVWYLLAPPESTEPWHDAVYVSETQTITDLTASETRDFIFHPPPTELVGEVRVRHGCIRLKQMDRAFMPMASAMIKRWCSRPTSI